ncbi:hypothetical protein [Streptomyces prasinus]|uniref:hypothetical protein n=1 Tax=Streptomyces prasinus TaxID=67345 RepID=UPI0033A3CA1B
MGAAAAWRLDDWAGGVLLDVGEAMTRVAIEVPVGTLSFGPGSDLVADVVRRCT